MTRSAIDSSAEAFAERVFASVLGVMDISAIHVGDKLGLYEAMATHGPLTSTQLTDLTQIHSRYATEWLEHQAVSGIVTVDDVASPPEHRVYRLPEGHAEVLTDADSLAYLTPFARLVMASMAKTPELIEAYKGGGGVSWSEFGDDMRTGTAEMNRPWFINELGASWFPSVPAVQAKLEAGARVADVGSGEGWSSIAMARAYSNVHVDAFDIDAPSVAAARRQAQKEGVADRTTFTAVDIGVTPPAGRYDIVTAFECIHDMPDPVAVLRSMRSMVKDDGTVIVMDEAVGDHFGDRFDDIERLMYGFSMFICLPDAMSHQQSVGTGTVMRPSSLEKYAVEAGFTGIDVLPIDNDMWRFYQLTTV